MTTWRELVKKITKLPQYKGKGLSVSLKHASKLWKQMKGKSKGGDGDVKTPSDIGQTENNYDEHKPDVSGLDDFKSGKGGRSTKRKYSKKNKTRRK